MSVESPAAGLSPVSEVPSPLRSKGSEQSAHYAQLVRQVCRGNKAALSNLYRMTARQLLDRARSIVGSTADAEEIVNDVYTQVWQFPFRYEPARGSVLSWLHAICRSRAIDRYRLNQRRDFMENAWITDIPLNWGTGNDEDLPSHLETLAAQRALDDLSPLRRELLTIVYFGGMTQEQAAEELRIPVGTAKSHLRRTLHKLRCALAQPSAPRP